MKKIITIVLLILAVGAITTPASAANRAKVRRPGPLRVLLVGDSLTLSYQDEAAVALQAKGYQVIKSGIGGTGLLDVNQCSGSYASTLLAYTDPDIVVMEGVGNYINAPFCYNGVKGSKDWLKAYKTSARLSQNILTDYGAEFFWVLNPAALGGQFIPEVNNIYRQVGTLKTQYIDAWSAFGGFYNPSLHVEDGLHLNQAGQQKLADLVVKGIG